MQSHTDHLAHAEQRKAELIIAWAFVAGGVGTTVLGLFDSGSQLTTAWDDAWIPITNCAFFITGLVILAKPQWITAGVVLSMLASSIYQQGMLYLAVQHPDPVSYYSAASGAPFGPLLYIAPYIVLPRWATLLSSLHCLGFFAQFLIHNTLLADPSPSSGRIESEHLLVAVMMSHPIYIVALRYIVQLRERLYRTQQEAFQSKAGFLGMLSHEVRNLLQTMVSAIDLLDLRLKEPAERKSVARLHTAAAQLQTYLCDINELTKLEDPTLRTQIGRVDIPALLEDLREEWLPRAAERDLALSVVIKGSSDDSRFKIGTDEARLRQIVANLVSNALKYTRQGSIVISAALPTEAALGVVVEVADTGIGIENRFLEKIFEPYVRLENPLLGRSEGSGLGLAIVKRLVESIGGTIRVESKPSHGTRFVVTVPGQC